MAKKNPATHDDERQRKWSQPRVVYTEDNPPPKPRITFEGDPGLTDQAQAKDCDVNFILKKFQQTGVLPGIDAQRLYADVSDPTTYHEAMDIVVRAQEQFEALDAHTRMRFLNDPARFMEFIHDPKNGPEIVELGLATRRPPTDTDRLISEIRASNEIPEEAPPPSPADPKKRK